MFSQRQRALISVILWVGVSLSTSPWQHSSSGGFFASISPSPSFFPPPGVSTLPQERGQRAPPRARGTDGTGHNGTAVFTGAFWAHKLDYHHCRWPQCERSHPRSKAGAIRGNASHWHTTEHAAAPVLTPQACGTEGAQASMRPGPRKTQTPHADGLQNGVCSNLPRWTEEHARHKRWGGKKEAKGWGEGGEAWCAEKERKLDQIEEEKID